MLRFVVRRLFLLVPILIGVSLLVFGWIHALPGSPAEALLGEHATPQAIAQIRHQYGLDKPISVQYWAYLKSLATLNFGSSILDQRPVLESLAHKFPATVELSVAAMLFAVVIGIPLGFFAANERAAKSIRPGMHGSTFGGNALAARVALEFFDILDGLLPQIRRVGEYFRSELRRLAGRFDFITEVRGYWLMVGAELKMPGKEIVNRAMQEGLLMNCTHETVLRFLPPYIVTEKEVDQAVKIVAKLVSKLK